MRNKIFIALLGVILAINSFGQNKDYYAPSSANSMFARIIVKTALMTPTGCGAPAGMTDVHSDTLNRSAEYYDSCGHKKYVWDPQLKVWKMYSFSSDLSVFLIAGNNLADVTNINTARSNLNAEDLSNKSTSTSLGTSNTLYPTQNAVKTYVDGNAVLTSGSYTNPSWIVSLIQSKITGLPDSLLNKVTRSGSYSDPSWVTSLAWSKISGAPTFLQWSDTGTTAAKLLTAGRYQQYEEIAAADIVHRSGTENITGFKTFGFIQIGTGIQNFGTNQVYGTGSVLPGFGPKIQIINTPTANGWNMGVDNLDALIFEKFVGATTYRMAKMDVSGNLTLSGAIDATNITASGSVTVSSATITGTISAGAFSGAGTYLYGTATGLSIGGNASTVTNGVYTTGSYNNPSWITGLAWSKITSTPTTISGYGITDAYTKTTTDAKYFPFSGGTITGTVTATSFTGSLNWANVTGRPTTISGYGITDAFTMTTADARYLRVTGGTLSGQLTATTISVSGILAAASATFSNDVTVIGKFIAANTFFVKSGYIGVNVSNNTTYSLDVRDGGTGGDIHADGNLFSEKTGYFVTGTTAYGAIKGWSTIFTGSANGVAVLPATFAGIYGNPQTTGVQNKGILRIQDSTSNISLDFGIVQNVGAWINAQNKANSAVLPLFLNPSGGGVAIGFSTAQSATLAVNGGARSAGTSAGFTLDNRNNTNEQWTLYGSTSGLQFYNTTLGSSAATLAQNGAITFANAITVNTGTSNFNGQINSYQLNVNGASSTSNIGASAGNALDIRQYDGSFTGDVIALRASRTQSGNAYQHISAYENGTTRVFRVLANGDVQNTNNSYGALSDIKLKENIVSISDSSLYRILQVNVVNYTLKADSSKRQMLGVIAQQIEPYFPEMVDSTPDSDSTGVPNGSFTKSVKYSYFTLYLIKAVQTQQLQIEALKTDFINYKQSHP